MIKQTESGVMITGEHIEVFRLLAIRGRLRLELKGLRFKVATTPVVAHMAGKQRMTRKAALAWIEAKLEEAKPKPVHNCDGSVCGFDRCRCLDGGKA